MVQLKNSFAIALLGVLCAYAIYQELEFLSIAMIFAILALIYKNQTQRVLDMVIDLLSGTKQAKFGDLEIHMDKKLQDFSELAVQKAVWVQILLSQLSSKHMGLLFTIYKEDKYTPTNALKNELRDLRARGLLHHDAPTMNESTQVWLTDLGKELAKTMLESPVEVENISEGNDMDYLSN